jgi:hypothetical protein
MNPFLGNRLTWNPVAPAPFESGWSIFAKILAHNHMNIGELAALIRKSDAATGKFTPLDFSDSDWIDFDKLGMLLEVEPKRLKTGFLDQIGFYPTVHKYERYKVRHCPKCAELGYHCSLFDLAIVAECPWHRCALRRRCNACATPLTLNGISRFLVEGLPTCPQCGMPIENFLDFSELNKLSSDMHATILGYCVELVDWWREVREATRGFPDLAKELEKIGEGPSELDAGPDVLLGYATAVSSQKIYWKFMADPWPARYFEWPAKLLDSSAGGSRSYSSAPTGKMYRSIRRHLYKRFVRPHRHCLAALMSLTRDEVFALRGDKVCVVALAYLVWRMSIEEISNIEELKSPKRTIHRLRLMGPGDWRINLPLVSRLHWTYSGFFGLWQTLHTRLPRLQRVVIEIVGSEGCEGFLHWRLDELETFGSSRTGGDSRDILIKVICPDCPPLESHGRQNARKGKASCNSFLDIHSFNNQQIWYWAIDHYSRQRCLFQFTYARWGNKSQFVHLTV